MTKIYCLFDENEIPFYIGKTKNTLSKRESQHQKRLNRNCFIFELDNVEDKEWNFWEKHYISLFKSWGFNLENKNEGGGGLSNHSEKTKEKMSLTPRPETSKKLKGKKRPDVSKRFKGKNLSPETIQKIIDKKTNHYCYDDPLRGEKIKKSNQSNYKPGSDRNQKIKQKLTNREITWVDKFKIPVCQFDKQNNFITEFPSATEAGLSLNKKSSAISECCNKKRKSAYGYVWMFKSDYVSSILDEHSKTI